MRSPLGYSSSGGRVRQSYVASTFWSLPQSITCILHIQLPLSSTRLLPMHPLTFPAPVLVVSIDPDLAPVLLCVRVLESTLDSILPAAHHRWSIVSSWRLTALEDSVTSMHVRMSAEFLETRASIRSINQALVDLKSSLTEQIKAGFAEIRSNMPVQQDRDYSITYTRWRKRKASEADFGADDNLAREIGSTSQTLHIFEPNLPVITEESSEDIQVTPDARMSGGEATTSRDAGVRSLAETVTLKVNNSLARVRASMLDRSPSRIRGFTPNMRSRSTGPWLSQTRVSLSFTSAKLSVDCLRCRSDILK
ncbi:uncharacterized protein [Primulina eburnea]|uniref:uncharacterized protein n=1 Tax=Primulina eburnea TaxID=1245227 RepID=UPI003C6C530D